VSFLEKLKKGMQNQAVDNDTPDSTPEVVLLPTPAIPTESQIDSPNATAVFASYKRKPPKKNPVRPPQKPAGLKELEDFNQPDKLIITPNIEEAPLSSMSDFVAGKETQKEESTVKNTQKNMANKKSLSAADVDEGGWLDNEGQLAVNLFQTENDLILQAAIAGIKADDLDILIEDDVITVKGNRPNPLTEDGDYFIEECYFGSFSRKIILPVDADSSRADAAMKDGILTIRIPKIQREKKKKVAVKS